jgi:hypothetical protein
LGCGAVSGVVRLSQFVHQQIQTSTYEERKIEQELGRKCKSEDLLLSQERLAKYMRQEANLKTEPADWEKVFSAAGKHAG